MLPIHSYDYTPAPKFHGVGPRFFGVELEVEVTLREESRPTRLTAANALVDLVDPSASMFYLKRDGSIKNGGFEIVTHPFTLEASEQFPWEQITGFLSKVGMASDTHDCGLHIHVSRDAAASETWMRVGYFVNDQQETFEKLARRSSQHYSQFKKKELAEGSQSVDRYEAVNFTNRETVEFRMFRGTLDPEIIRGSLELVNAIVDFCQEVSSEALLQKSKARLLFEGFLAHYPRANRLYDRLVRGEEESNIPF